jgi:DNA-binding NarL/FixJ family response regulator
MIKAGFILAVESYLIRKGLASVLNRIPGISVVKEFSNASGLEAFARSHQADFLVISVSLLDRSLGIPPMFDPALDRIILLEEVPGDRARVAGMEVVGPGDTKERLLEVIRRKTENLRDHRRNSPETELTPREITILKLVSQGLTNKQIADELFLSAHTVITHRKNISSKLGIKSVSGLTIYAIVNNFITIGEATAKGER